MPSRKFVYGTGGVVEVTPAETRALCEEIHKDVESRAPVTRCRSGRNASIWPVHSDSLACSSKTQVHDEQAELAKHGVRTEYDEDFRPIFTSRAHKKAHYRALEYYDPDAGYGDAEPLKFHSGIKPHSPENRKRRLEEMRQELIAKEYRLFGQRVSSL